MKISHLDSGASAAAFSLRKGFLRKSLSERRQKKRFADFRKEIEQGEIKWMNKKKKLKKYSEHLTKHLRLRQRIVFKVILVRLGAFMTETFERHRSNQNRNTN